MLCGEIAYHVQGVAVAWHLFALHHRSLDLGLAGGALFLPALLFALPAGACADRFERRRIVVLTQGLEALCSAALLAALQAGVTALWAYLALLAGLGTVRAFGAPAERSLLPQIVPAASFTALQSRYAALRQATSIAGPALGGALVAVGLVPTFATTIGLALLGGACIAGIAPAPPPAEPAASTAAAAPARRERRAALEGLRFIAAHPVVAGAISLDLFAVLFGGATALLPAFADGVFRAGPAGLGLLRCAPAAGACATALYLARAPLRRRVGRTLLAAVAAFGAATILFGLSRDFALSLAALAVAGGADMVSVVVRSSLVQLATPDAMRGRVSAVENIFIGASNELGALESGALAGWIGAVPAVVLGGVGTLAVIALWGVLFPALRRADRFVAETA